VKLSLSYYLLVIMWLFMQLRSTYSVVVSYLSMYFNDVD
jgi:hypothetical protein